MTFCLLCDNQVADNMPSMEILIIALIVIIGLIAVLPKELTKAVLAGSWVLMALSAILAILWSIGHTLFS